MPRLSFTLSSGAPLLLELHGERITIGRTRENDLVVPEETVSSQHGEFTRNGDSYVYKDNGSTNGSKINGADILFGYLQSGDRLMLGTCEGIYLVNAGGSAGDATLARLCESLAHGDATAIHVFPANQEANARAQLKLCRAWLEHANCPLDVVLLEAVDPAANARFLLIETGTREAQWQLTKTVEDPAFARFQKKTLTSAERRALEPAECHENFPQQGGQPPPAEGFRQLARKIVSGEYHVLDGVARNH